MSVSTKNCRGDEPVLQAEGLSQEKLNRSDDLRENMINCRRSRGAPIRGEYPAKLTAKTMNKGGQALARCLSNPTIELVGQLGQSLFNQGRPKEQDISCLHQLIAESIRLKFHGDILLV